MTYQRSKIIVVDDNATNLTACKSILKPFYGVYPAQSALKMFELLEMVHPDLILLDVDMPNMNGYEAAELLKGNEKYRNIPIIFLTARRDEESEVKGLSLGAVDYIFKPFVSQPLLKRIETHLSLIECQNELREQNKLIQKMLALKTGQVSHLQNAVLEIVADLVEFRDNVTGGHVNRTQRLLRCIIDKLIEEGIYHNDTDSWSLDYVLPSAQLHDVGKIGISDAILNKPGRLTPEEFDIMKTHVQIGVDAISHMEQITDDPGFFAHAKAFAGMHHEKWDGSGYPYGLHGLEIPLEGRLMALVDVYDALISTRPYKPPFTIEQANSIITEGRGTHFDPQLVDVFRAVSHQFAEIVREIYEGSRTTKQAMVYPAVPQAMPQVAKPLAVPQAMPQVAVPQAVLQTAPQSIPKIARQQATAQTVPQAAKQQAARMGTPQKLTVCA